MIPLCQVFTLSPPRSDTIGYIIPVFNESEILRDELLELSNFLDSFDFEYEIIVVENGSDDETPQILNQLENNIESVSSLSLPRADYGQALKYGMKQTPHERNFLLNIDWWDTDFIEGAIQELDEHDLVIGSKRLAESSDHRSGYRKLLSWGLNFLLKRLVGFEGTETHGLKAFRKSVIEDILEKSKMKRGMFDTEVVIRAEKEGLSIKELPVTLIEDRPPRNWMAQKIGQNLVDIWHLTYVIRWEYGFSR